MAHNTINCCTKEYEIYICTLLGIEREKQFLACTQEPTHQVPVLITNQENYSNNQPNIRIATTPPKCAPRILTICRDLRTVVHPVYEHRVGPNEQTTADY